MIRYVRMTKLTSVKGGLSGRSEYCRNKGEEELWLHSAPVDWKPYREFERSNQKSGSGNNEGRELVIALPNEWIDLSADELRKRCDEIAATAIGKSSDKEYFVHNKPGNFHMHVIFSERTADREPKFYTKDVYLTADGKVAVRSADRAKDAAGHDLPPIHKKGDKKPGGFTAKDKRYKEKGWLQGTKETLEKKFVEYGAVYKQKQPFKQQHVGKGKHTQKFKDYNECVNVSNLLFPVNLSRMSEETPNRERSLIRKMAAAIKALMIYVINRDGSREEISLGSWRRALEIAAIAKTAPVKPQNAPEPILTPPAVQSPPEQRKPPVIAEKPAELPVKHVPDRENLENRKETLEKEVEQYRNVKHYLEKYQGNKEVYDKWNKTDNFFGIKKRYETDHWSELQDFREAAAWLKRNGVKTNTSPAAVGKAIEKRSNEISSINQQLRSDRQGKPSITSTIKQYEAQIAAEKARQQAKGEYERPRPARKNNQHER